MNKYHEKILKPKYGHVVICFNVISTNKHLYYIKCKNFEFFSFMPLYRNLRKNVGMFVVLSLKCALTENLEKI